MKYDDLISTLYSLVYPRMIDMKLKSSQRNSSLFKCPHGHKLIEADHTKRKLKNGSHYSSTSYNCDICHHSFANSLSWHCSCTDSGFDKCAACLVFQLYNIDNNALNLASRDREKQQIRCRRDTIHAFARLQHSLFRFLTGGAAEDNNNNNELDLLPARQQSPSSN